MPDNIIANSVSGHLVDPELADFLQMFPLRQLDAKTLGSARQLWSELSVLAPLSDDEPVSRDIVEIPAADGAVTRPALLYRPKAPVEGLRPALLYIHSGGYVIGAPEMNDLENRQLAGAHNCVVLAPSYRLAPETIFPGAIEDCYAALTWLFANAATLGVDPSKVVVSGESAGGGLTAALMLLARDRGEHQVAGQILLSAMIDDRTGSTRDCSPYAGEFIWPMQFNRFGWTSLLGHPPGGDDVSPYAAAARAESVAGLPSTYISIGALDLFLAENLEYARRLADSGVPVEMNVYSGAFHGFTLARESNLVTRYYRDQYHALQWLWKRSAL